MAVRETNLKIYSGTTASGTPYLSYGPIAATGGVGVPSITIGSPSLGGNDCLMPGSQYCCQAQCISDQGGDSGWMPTIPYPFKTLIAISWAERPGTIGQPDVSLNQNSGEWRLYVGEYTVYDDGMEDGTTAGAIAYDANAMSLDAVYVYVGTTNNISSAVRLTTDARNIEHDYFVNNSMLSQAGAQFTFQENTTYYVWLGVTDDTTDATRTYTTSPASVTSGAAVPIISMTNETHTYQSVGATVRVDSSENISSITATLAPTGGGTTYTKNLSTSSPQTPQTVTFTNGDTDAGGNTVVVTPNTPYRLTITVVTPSHPSTTDYRNITTDAQAVSTINITGVSYISPSGATVNLVYGSGQ